jgi:hypothetical protein
MCMADFAFLMQIVRFKQHMQKHKTFNSGSISIGFAWDRVQNWRDDMPRGSCPALEARKRQMNTVFSYFKNHEIVLFSISWQLLYTLCGSGRDWVQTQHESNDTNMWKTVRQRKQVRTTRDNMFEQCAKNTKTQKRHLKLQNGALKRQNGALNHQREQSVKITLNKTVWKK